MNEYFKSWNYKTTNKEIDIYIININCKYNNNMKTGYTYGSIQFNSKNCITIAVVTDLRAFLKMTHFQLPR